MAGKMSAPQDEHGTFDAVPSGGALPKSLLIMFILFLCLTFRLWRLYSIATSRLLGFFFCSDPILPRYPPLNSRYFGSLPLNNRFPEFFRTMRK